MLQFKNSDKFKFKKFKVIFQIEIIKSRTLGLTNSKNSKIIKK